MSEFFAYHTWNQGAYLRAGPASVAPVKRVYMAIMSLDPTGKGQVRRAMRWKTALNAFDITLDGRLQQPASNPTNLVTPFV
ncbi:hypothetical protein [Streptomyces sp. NPDC048521]|uniref:hypothetical protein n=1 Tax=Streptomyces sp. NPDC048521 TaxID=3365566 RepID=UPI0037180AA3